MSRLAIRWSGENDRYFGPFTYARERRGYTRLGIVLDSGDDEYRGCSLRIHLAGHTLIVRLPSFVLRPHRTKVYPKSWDAATIARLGRDWYWDIDRRTFGFTTFEGAVHFYFGRHTMDSSTDRSKCWFIPWRSWRHVRRSFYGLRGERVATLPDTGKSYLGDPGRWDRERAIEDGCPTVRFAFCDYDGEALFATTRIEEREWRLGTGKFRWLSWFKRPKIRRSLSIDFSGETGRRKGSWKGGTMGTGIDMLPGELHESAFRRYCAEHDMTFAGRALEEVPAA